MKSNLKRIYDLRKKFDIYNNPYYLFYSNPIYKVNDFITRVDANLAKNLRKNMEDLSFIKANYYYYNNYLNILYYDYDNKKDDIWGVLEIASNDINKEYPGGIVLEGEIGTGLNNGLTEYYESEIGVNRYRYPLESLVAQVLLSLDFNLVTNSYFNNNGEQLLLLSKDIKNLIKYVDEYHRNYNILGNLHIERLEIKDSEFNEIKKKKIFNELNNYIFKLETDNYSNVYYIISYLINIIKNSKLEDFEKQSLYKNISEQFKCIFNVKEFKYLNEVTRDLDMLVLVKKKEE